MVAGRSDRRWLEGVLTRWERPLVAYARRITGDLESAREVVQETFLRLLQQERDSLDDHLAPWLFTVCRRLALDAWRKERRAMRPNLDPPGVSSEPEWVVERDEDTEGMLAALAELPTRQQEALRLRFEAGLSYREIADVTGWSVSNVGYLLHVALKRLRSEMADENGSEATVPGSSDGGAR